MAELFSNPSAFLVFLAIAALGFVFLLVSLVFGEIFDHLGGDHDLDHGGPGFFSTRIMSVFITAFGGTGAVGVHYGLSTLASSGLGFASGVFFASLIFAFARFLYGQQASSEVRSTDVVGRTARVVVAIPAGGMGQVRCQVGEAMIDKIARAQDGDPIPENAMVEVAEVLGEMVVVRRR